MLRPLVAVLLLLTVARAAEPHPSLPPPVIPDCLGVNIHFTDPKPGELEMLAGAGFKWVRMDFSWGATERKKGEYDFSAYDRLVAALDKFKLRAVFILDYGNPLYADPGDSSPFTSRAHMPEFREAFGKWAVAAVQHFQGRGYLWEMWNEPNGGFWKSPDKTGDYIALAKSTGEALRQAGLLRMRRAEGGRRNGATAPALSDSALRTPHSELQGEAFIGPATSTIDMPYLEACFKAGLLEYWDAVSVHPYRQNSPESVGQEYRLLRELIKQYAPRDKVIPIISGEWGYSSAWKGFSEEKQAQYLFRELLHNAGDGIPLSIWYDWHDDGPDPREAEHHFGLVRHEYHPGRDPVYDPKPAYEMVRALTSQPMGVVLRYDVLGYLRDAGGDARSFRGLIPIADWLDRTAKVVAEGDAKVESTQSVLPALPPDAEPPAEHRAVKLSYRFGAGWKYLSIPWQEMIRPLPTGGTGGQLLPPARLGWWIHGDASGCHTRVRFVDATGQTFQADGPKIVWKGWQYATFPLRPSEDAALAHWGGANDGVIHYPIKWNAVFLLDNVSRQPLQGEIYLSAPTLVY